MEHISKAQIKLIRSLQHKKYRDESGLFVAEGEKCIEELRKAFELELMVRNQESGVRNQESGVRSQDNCLVASQTEIEQMSGLRTPQGVIAVFRKPEAQQIADCKLQNSNLTLALDGIQDPGNLGTIIRTCDWFGVKEILCSLDTADCYNPKVVQATMGGLARVRIRYVDLVEWLEGVRSQESGVRIYGTLLEGRNMYEEGAIPTKEGGVIIMGNEGNGISAEVRKYITHPLRIPAYKEASDTIESLNVAIATAIVLAEFRR